MTEKVGRNDPCHCGSGKKYKQCCMKDDLAATAPRGLKKFTAKVISAGGAHKAEVQENKPSNVNQAFVDYNTLMERSFGSAIHSDEAPPIPTNPSQYLSEGDKKPK